MGKAGQGRRTRTRFRLLTVAWVGAYVAAVVSVASAGAAHAAPRPTAVEQLRTLGVPGGLAVCVGRGQFEFAKSLADTGQFLSQVLSRDANFVEQTRRQLVGSNVYGLLSVDLWRSPSRLPYTENLVNVLVLAGPDASQLSAAEVTRVLTPNGVVLTSGQHGPSLDSLKGAGLVPVRKVDVKGSPFQVLRKPWPAGMDQWTHPRHSASGNAASNDQLVGPPRRVRWVVHAPEEVRGLVSANGRNFYAAVLARDAFNGLRLWNRDLLNPQAGGPLVMKNLPNGTPAPIAVDNRVYGVLGDRLVALDASTGEVVREYPEAGRPHELLYDDGLLIVADAHTLQALRAETGELLWTQKLSAPRNVVAGDSYVALVAGQPARGQKAVLVTYNKQSGKLLWQNDQFDWAARVYRIVYHDGLLAYEESSLNNDAPGNCLHMVDAKTGKVLWERKFPPGMNHIRQARALFIGPQLWVLYGGRADGDSRLPLQWMCLDPQTGNTLKTLPGALAHCFPPVATPRFLLSGEMNFTDLYTGQLLANHITKAACGREYGWLPANGLVYVTPKHCVCWPMLRGYAALAPERPEGDLSKKKLEELEFPLERVAAAPDQPAAEDPARDWPIYRHDAWRSSSTPSEVPTELKVLWSRSVGAWPEAGPIVYDWRENPFTKGPVTAPVISNGRVYVAVSDAHRVVALDADTGRVLWQFTANGRVDTPPTVYKGLCLFGTKAGWVYCLNAATGELIWRLRAAPLEEQIVAYGQVESPWPVPGSVLVVDDTAYFAAGRQPLADGGIFVFAVDPRTGQRRWVQRLDSVPQQGFYESSALEFDNFDLLFREGSAVSMSRWKFDRQTGQMTCDRWNAFARLNTGGGEAWVPRGAWSYPPRHRRRIKSYTPLRPLVAFRDNVVYGCKQGATTLFRRDFHLDQGEKFETHWMTGWAAGQLERKGEPNWPNDRLAQEAKWLVDVFDKKSGQTVVGLVLAGDKLLLVGSQGELQVRSTADGSLLFRTHVPTARWDGLAVAGGRAYLTTADGQLLCLGQ